MTINRTSILAGISGLAVLVAPSAFAGSHLWRFNEIFSNADGTIQFIELKECCGSDDEKFLVNKWVSSDATNEMYVFPHSLTEPTANRHLLIATAGFAALPGAPTPDFIMQDGLFSLTGDTLRYWSYAAATMTYGPDDLPTDGVTSMTADLSTEVNSPTNFAGATGSVTAGGGPVPTTSQWGFLTMTLAVLAAATLVLRMRGRRLSVPPG
jgi:hypothetical protein